MVHDLIVATETRSVKKTVFVEATEALGVGSAALFGHILPNVLSSIIVRSTLSIVVPMTAAVLGF